MKWEKNGKGWQRFKRIKMSLEKNWRLIFRNGCYRSRKSQGKMQFFKVKEKTGNFILSQGKIYVFERSCGKVKLHVRCMWLTESINLWVESLTKGGRVEVIIRTRLWNCTFNWSRKLYVCQKKGRKFQELMIVVTTFEIHQIKSGNKTWYRHHQNVM